MARQNDKTKNTDAGAIADDGTAAGSETQQRQFAMQRLYLKDMSFESPGAPDVFRQAWKPQLNIDLHTSSSSIGNDHYETVLTVTVTAKQENKTAFLVEVQQAGVFLIEGIEGEELQRLLAIACPNTLFPYAREAIDGIVNRGSFPSLMLAPVNFEALYRQAREQQPENITIN